MLQKVPTIVLQTMLTIQSYSVIHNVYTYEVQSEYEKYSICSTLGKQGTKNIDMFVFHLQAVGLSYTMDKYCYNSLQFQLVWANFQCRRFMRASNAAAGVRRPRTVDGNN